MDLRNQALLAALAAAMFFANLGGAHLWDVDEAIFSQAAKEMLQRGDYVTPYFNGGIFPDKPGMMYWLMISAYKVFGTTEFAARFWSAVFGVGSVLVTYRLGRLMFSPGVAFWSGLMLATCINFNVIARAATPDAFLTFFCSLAVLVFVSGTAKARAVAATPNERNAPWAGQTKFEPSWANWALTYSVMGLAVLTKGPVGVVLPTAVIGLFLLVMRAPQIAPSERGGWRGAIIDLLRWIATLLAPRHLFGTIWSMRPLTALAAVLAVAGPWYVWVGLRTDWVWPAGFFGVHNFGRFLNAMENHRGPIFYYLIAIAIGFFPWSVLFAPTINNARRQLADRHHPWRAGYVLVGAWFAVWVGFFSLAGTKLPSYVVPAYPAIALAVATLVDTWLREPVAIAMPRFWTRMAWGTVAAVGLGIMVAMPIVGRIYLNGDWVLALLGIIPLTAAAVGIVLGERGRARAGAWTLGGLGACFSLALFAFGAAHVDRYQENVPLAGAIAEATPPGQQPAIGSLHYFRPSFVFYADAPIAKFESVDEVQTFFAAHPTSAFLLTTDAQYERVRASLPPGVDVIHRRPKFLRSGEVLLLGRRDEAAATAARNATGRPPKSAY